MIVAPSVVVGTVYSDVVPNRVVVSGVITSSGVVVRLLVLVDGTNGVVDSAMIVSPGVVVGTMLSDVV